MKKINHKHLLLVFCAALAVASTMSALPAAAQLFGIGDPIIAIDTDANSNYPGGEAPGNVADQDSMTKYLNFGGEQTGFIITPGFGSTTIQSLQLTTGGDAPERDPLTFDLYGTNDAIMSGDNSRGDLENWTLISSGMTGLDTDPGRQLPGSIVDFGNGASFSSYKMIFPTLRDAMAANSMQVADVSLFTGAGGLGAQILATMDPALAVTDSLGSGSSYPGGEGPAQAIDGDAATKYLNFAGKNSGFIVNRADGLATIIENFQMTTGNDEPGRDPAAWALYGTDDPVTSADNSLGDQENWSLVDSGMVMLPDDRGVLGPLVDVNNATAYSAYRMVMTDLKDTDNAIMQVAEVTFGGTVVPEPSSLLCLWLGACCLGRFRPRR